MALEQGTGAGGDSPTAYQIVSQLSTFRVNANNTTTAIEQLVVRSLMYDVTFMFNVTHAVFLADGAPILAAERTQQVNAFGAHPHVVGLRGEEDQGADGNLYNYLVVTVGSDDGERTTDVRIRMDQLGSGSRFDAVDNAWNLINNLGPVV